MQLKYTYLERKKMRISGETKFFIGVITATIVLVVVGVVFLSRPAPSFTREEMIFKDSYIRGSDKADVFLVEFSDFQCPACAAAKPDVDAIVSENKNKLAFVYRHFPLDQHAFAFKAALAAESAGEQGKFWQMYDYLFENQNSLSDKVIMKAADKLELDKTKFEESYSNKKYQDKVNKDLSDGRKFGVDSTPTFFLNGQKVSYVSYQDLKRVVEEAIKKTN